MKRPEIIAIAALGKNTHFICADDKLLWTNPTDLKRVKEQTTGFPIIMGRKTHESIGKPLPNRTNIVMTTNKDYVSKDCTVVHSVEEALQIAQESDGGNEKIFIFGGSEIYNLFLNKTDKLMLTLVNSEKEGTHKFPEFENEFKQIAHHGSHEFENEVYEWVDYQRK
ncbi:MAG: dihydrofolate reductase [Candidatus Paceibacteria bacterium]